ncbi:MAG: transposase [bacterium]
MAQRKVNFYKGNYYHIYNRGANRESIFRSEENYLFLLKRFGKAALEKSITVIAYCLMPNHYHFLLRQDGETIISDLMQETFNSYSKAFNKMYNRTGTLFEGPFKSIHIDKDNYLTHLCRYIHRNPLEAGLVTDLEKWSFSNYLEWIGERSGRLVDLAFIEFYFKTAEAYREFVFDCSIDKKKPGDLSNYFFD